MKFIKGFYGKENEAEAFHEAVLSGDCAEIAAVAELSGSQRSFVDSFIFAAPRSLRPPRTIKISLPEVDYHSAAFLGELQELYDLAEQRDVPLTELSRSLPRGLRTVSPFLDNVRVQSYTKDYMTDAVSWEAVQRGELVPPPVARNQYTNLNTGRALATYVHNDNPMTPFIRAVEIILGEGIEPITAPQMQTRFKRNQSFTLHGGPYLFGLLGEALLRAGIVSFQMKWKNVVARPEEAAVALRSEFLPMAYPEGSPMHPSRVAMHSMAALVQSEVIKQCFDPEQILQYTDESIADSVDLLADNIGLARLWAGVHYRADHEAARPAAKAVAKDLITKYSR